MAKQSVFKYDLRDDAMDHLTNTTFKIQENLNKGWTVADTFSASFYVWVTYNVPDEVEVAPKELLTD